MDSELSCLECGARFPLSAEEVSRYNCSGIDLARLCCRPCTASIRASIAVEPENVTSSHDKLSETIPGLRLIYDFVSNEEEAEIMREIDDESCGCEWTEEMSRRVKHFGFPFNYRTLMLDFCKETPPLPVTTSALARKIEQDAMPWAIDSSIRYSKVEAASTAAVSVISIDHLDLPLTQMTANEYIAGQGIAPHTDTTTCFGPLIFILTCSAGITMTFRRNKRQVDGGISSAEEGPVNHPMKISIWLPRRSLLIMSAESRFDWSHSIASRKFDNVNGELIQRARRVSLTFRQVINYI